MSYWNFRLVFEDRYNTLSLSEVFYDDDDSPWGWAPVTMEGYVNLEDIRQEYKMLEDAFKKPVLHSADLRKNGKEKWEKDIKDGRTYTSEEVKKFFK